MTTDRTNQRAWFPLQWGRQIKPWARALKTELAVLALAVKHPGCPWSARFVAACVVGYAFSPIDLIPDIVPVLGYLDDVILLPLGILLARRLIPAAVLAECRQRARDAAALDHPRNRIAAAVIVALWVTLAIVAVWMVRRW